MITITSVIGNIFNDKELGDQFQEVNETKKSEKILLSRVELEKKRLRRKTNRGTDVGIVLNSTSRMHNGDVLVSSHEKFIVIEQVPEKVIMIKTKKQNDDEDYRHTLVVLGHIIGNRHRPILVDKNGLICFPISEGSEVEVFKKLFSDIINRIDITVEERIFEPNKEMDVHEHH